MMTDRMAELIAYTRQAAATIEHEWDARAIDWPLTKKSVVVEVGGYVGRWALQIAERYAPRLYVFEPQPWAAAVCRAVLGVKASIWPCALGTYDGTASMGGWETDGCSLVKNGADLVQMCEIGRVFREIPLTKIDLMLINIEGYEYTLIPHMLDQGITPKRLMVQCHKFAGDTEKLFQRIADAGYQVLWSYGAMLTAWGR